MHWHASAVHQHRRFAELSGVALPVRASVGRTHFENAILITHRGLSGPAILQISSYWQNTSGAPLVLNLPPAGVNFGHRLPRCASAVRQVPVAKV